MFGPIDTRIAEIHRQNIYRGHCNIWEKTPDGQSHWISDHQKHQVWTHWTL